MARYTDKQVESYWNWKIRWFIDRSAKMEDFILPGDYSETLDEISIADTKFVRREVILKEGRRETNWQAHLRANREERREAERRENEMAKLKSMFEISLAAQKYIDWARDKGLAEPHILAVVRDIQSRTEDD
jgi:hypothetical protein